MTDEGRTSAWTAHKIAWVYAWFGKRAAIWYSNRLAARGE